MLGTATVHAQPTAPQFYMWVRPTDHWTDHQFEPIVLLFPGPNASGAEAAQMARDQIQNRATAGTLDTSRISITIGNFGNWLHDDEGTGFTAFSLFDEDDIINPPPAWENPNNPPAGNARRIGYMQPWMTHGIAKCKAWMEDFVTTYSSLTYTPPGGQAQPLPTPARFHFDVEVEAMCPIWAGVNATRVLEALPRETGGTSNRWHTANVPGFGTPQNPVTMNDLYWLAVQQYHWPPYQLGEPDTLNRDESPIHANNRHYFIWYYQICQRAVDGALNEAVYGVIRHHWPAVTPKVSNWGDIDADGQFDRFGWFSRPTQWSGPHYVPVFSSLIGETIRNRAWVHRGLPGAVQLYSDLDGPNPSGHYPFIWFSEPCVTSADGSAPDLYPFTPDHIGHNYYLPGHPVEDILDASFRMHRHQVESILHSPGSGGPENLTPWIIYPGVTYWPNKPAPYTHVITDEQVRRQLAMLRAKDLREILVWWDFGVSTYAPFRALYNQVYTPNLSAFSVAEGCQINSHVTLDTLHFTLRDYPAGDPVDETVQITVSGACDDAAATLQTTFVNLDPHLGDGLKLNLECKVSRANLSGRVYVRTDSDDRWTAIKIGDASGDPYRFGFYAPAHGDGWYETRRTFKIPASLIQDDALHVRVVIADLVSEVPDPFTAAFDLVQVYWSQDDPDPNLMSGLASGPAGRPQGADLTHNGIADVRDVLRFNDYYARAVPAADFNNDGVIDPTDAADFATAYTNP